MDQATFVSWHDFYLTMGTASASLIGLLFVALSLNLDAVMGESRDHVRAFAEQAFNSFSTVLLIAVCFLIPQHTADDLGVVYVVLAIIGGYRMLRRARTVWRAEGGIDSARWLSGAWRCLRRPCSDSPPPASGSCTVSPTRPTGWWR
jgi:hypothetical protein